MIFTSYFNWGTTVQAFDSEPTLFQQKQEEAQEASELLDYCGSSFLEPYFEQDNIVYPEAYTHLLPNFSSPYQSLDTFPYEDFGSLPFPKRQRCQQEHCYYDFTPTFFGGYAPNSCIRPELAQTTTTPHVISSSGNDENGKKMNERSVSAQSIAARERRRKITEKTQELGKLIPGGNKMNTAEMLQAASKYVKYLQAQVGILQHMENEKGGQHVEEMQIITSLTIQEKLSLEEKCLVPREFVTALKERSKPPISQELSRLLALQG
ncbi:hypothetical protein SLEP1_g38333 [Rubroshorea leprosula]|nr:hypothetical protein SLEP1_g38333 [Rubroshorea leprosula]